MKKIRDIDDYYDDEYDNDAKYKPRHFKENKPEPEKKRKWDREDSYRRPSDFDEHR